MAELNDELNEALRDTRALDLIHNAARDIARAEISVTGARKQAVTVASDKYFDMTLAALQLQRRSLMRLLKDWDWEWEK